MLTDLISLSLTDEATVYWYLQLRPSLITRLLKLKKVLDTACLVTSTLDFSCLTYSVNSELSPMVYLSYTDGGFDYESLGTGDSEDAWLRHRAPWVLGDQITSDMSMVLHVTRDGVYWVAYIEKYGSSTCSTTLTWSDLRAIARNKLDRFDYVDDPLTDEEFEQLTRS